MQCGKDEPAIRTSRCEAARLSEESRGIKVPSRTRKCLLRGGASNEYYARSCHGLHCGWYHSTIM
jgi:hypothetical protein